MEITVKRRTDDVQAWLDSDLRIWGAGRTQPEAIGDLVDTHRKEFGITIRIAED